jgi:hypothetical protein
MVWLRLVNAVIEIAAVALMLPATVILAHYGGRFRYLFIATLWITLTGFTWLTGVRINSTVPINDATVVTTLITGSVLVSATSIVVWHLYMSHHHLLPAKNSPAAQAAE